YKTLDIEKEIIVDRDKQKKESEIRTLRRKFTISAVFAVPLLYIAMVPMIPQFSFAVPAFLDPMKHPLVYALTQLLLVIPIIIAGRRFYTAGFRAILQRSPNMDSLIAIGTSAAVIYSLFTTLRIAKGEVNAVHEGLYFESAGVIITLILLGKTLEAVSKGKTSEAIKKLMGLAPKTAVVIRDGRETELPIEEVEAGDVISVKPGEKIPVDG
ncbi:MAG TPA: heavy metal translocating P-type ATPase, partial [Clostridiales bacterium]|nr:heavy metal translocating P-type ATPase [Clostridiales bacterium]